jgi:SAM-dependent methyltransferase
MCDDEYLAEEVGRRITARKILDVVAARAKAGRLLEVGCGHGLLLDEARRRGFDVVGLELSRDSAAHAREELGVRVHQLTLEQFAAQSDDAHYDAILLVDVIEHLDDPARALDLCVSLLAPGGALGVVTPDPSSVAARIAGPRWWGYLPAHTYLFPRRTLRELLAARGLVLTDDLPLTRTFSAGYWLSGLLERAAWLAGVRHRLMPAIPSSLLSVPLHDERIMVATNVRPKLARKPLVAERNGGKSVHVVLPAYNAAATLPLVAAELPPEAVDRALVVDDASRDDTAEVALGLGFDVVSHPANRGYGANQKTCYVRAAIDGADVVVMVHADHQYDAGLISEMVTPILEGTADVVLGSRLLTDRAIAGGMPRWKWVGNRFLTGLENLGFRRRYSEYHTGYRAFSVDFLRSIAFLRNNDGFSFDQEIFAQIVAHGAQVVEIPIPTRYFHEASSVSFTASVEYGLRTLYLLARYRLDERRGSWSLLRQPAVALGPEAGPSLAAADGDPT